RKLYTGQVRTVSLRLSSQLHFHLRIWTAIDRAETERRKGFKAAPINWIGRCRHRVAGRYPPHTLLRHL
ncbi:hypothetical protein BDZ91DRAFT_672444, partial [Kalaharituber pfeilii]